MRLSERRERTGLECPVAFDEKPLLILRPLVCALALSGAIPADRLIPYAARQTAFDGVREVVGASSTHNNSHR